MATKKTAKKATKAATPKKSSSELEITFESDIPKISREGRSRSSKYDELLDTVKERAQTLKGNNKVAVLHFETQSMATSRYSSVKTAVEKREDEAHWTVAVRSADEGFNLYIKWNDEAEEEESEDEDSVSEDEDEDVDF